MKLVIAMFLLVALPLLGAPRIHLVWPEAAGTAVVYYKHAITDPWVRYAAVAMDGTNWIFYPHFFQVGADHFVAISPISFPIADAGFYQVSGVTAGLRIFVSESNSVTQLP